MTCGVAIDLSTKVGQGRDPTVGPRIQYVGASVLASAFTKLEELVKSWLFRHATEIIVNNVEKQGDSLRVTSQRHRLDVVLFQLTFGVTSTCRIIKQH